MRKVFSLTCMAGHGTVTARSRRLINLPTSGRQIPAPEQDFGRRISCVSMGLWACKDPRALGCSRNLDAWTASYIEIIGLRPLESSCSTYLDREYAKSSQWMCASVLAGRKQASVSSPHSTDARIALSSAGRRTILSATGGIGNTLHTSIEH